MSNFEIEPAGTRALDCTTSLRSITDNLRPGSRKEEQRSLFDSQDHWFRVRVALNDPGVFAASHMGKPRFIEGVPVEFEAGAVAVSPLRLDADRIEPVFDLRIGRAKIRRPREQRASVAKRPAIQDEFEWRLREQAVQGLRFDGWILEYRKPTVDQCFDALFEFT